MNNNNPPCPHCGSSNVIKHNTYKKRYKCKEQGCGKTFSKNTTLINYTRAEKNILSLLINLLESDIEEPQTIKDLVAISRKIKAAEINKLNYKKVDYSESKNYVPIKCAYPQLLICKDPKSDNITFIKLPKYSIEENYGSQCINLTIYNHPNNIQD